jgi:hypothetical protein
LAEKTYDEMRKIKPQPAALNPKPRWYQYRRRALLFVLIAAALAMGVAGWHFHEPRPNCHTLPEVLASGKYDGFDVVQGPDRPGPYKDMGATCAGPGEPLSGSFWANGKTRRFHVPGVPGQQYLVYLPEGGTVKVKLAKGKYNARWFSPRNGQWKPIGIVSGPEWTSPRAPDNGDWAIVLCQEAGENRPTNIWNRTGPLGERLAPRLH